MERLFRIKNVQKFGLLGKKELIDYINYCQNSIMLLRRQIIDLQRENERLKLELGYGKTGSFLFEVGTIAKKRKSTRKKTARRRHA